eukprot:Hpha_TRINITY_DN16838_c0_g1::TRINITY_DN16838_c0_g1_i1::g.151654::m.151654/K14213/PEPD; Xaa-Pro dipeptidase
MSKKNVGKVAEVFRFKDGASYFHMGPGTHAVPMSMHRRHREKLCGFLRERLGDGGKNTAVLLKGGVERGVYDTDTHWDFKQESNFQWLFGVKEPGCLGAVMLDSAKSVLFVPKFPEQYQSWMGEIKPLSWFEKTYEVSECKYHEEAEQALRKEGVERVLVISGTNSDSGTTWGPEDWPAASSAFDRRTDGVLHEALAELRVVKDEDEIALLQFTNDVSSLAHIEVMRNCKGPSTMEYLCEATFKYHSFVRGCSRVGYACICPSGERNTALHYGHSAAPNDQAVDPDVLRLNDMGAEYHGYTADVTVTWPQSGKFSEPQAVVYNAVWEATQAVERGMRPGASWIELHQLSNRVTLTALRDAGILKGDVEEMMAADLHAYFMPHGLGHMLGLDVHDVGGYVPGTSRAMLKEQVPPITTNLRCGRTLAEGHVITVEPGCYFTKYLIEKVLADPSLRRFVDEAKLVSFAKEVGGVRIEDNVLVTASGCTVLTNVPRTTADIERVMAGEEWKGKLRVYSS